MQLERELIVERVKNGLRNAKLKGKQVGRKKTRPSELIRALLKSGMTMRAAAKVAGCSQGSINLEKKIMLKEENQQASNEIPFVKPETAAPGGIADPIVNW